MNENSQIKKEVFTLKQEMIHMKTKTDKISEDYNELNRKYNSLKKKHEKTNIEIDDETMKQFDDFISSQCIEDQETTTPFINLEGRFRIWSQSKLNNQKTNIFKHYLANKFGQIKNHHEFSFKGVRLTEINVNLSPETSEIEHFISCSCKFSDTSRLLTKRSCRKV